MLLSSLLSLLLSNSISYMSDKSLLFSRVVLLITFLSFFFALDNMFLDSVVCAFYGFIRSLSLMSLIQIIVFAIALLLIFFTNKYMLWKSYPDVYLCVNILSIIAIIFILILNFEYILTILEIILEYIIKIFGGGTGISWGGASGTGNTGPSKKPNPKGNNTYESIYKERQKKRQARTSSNNKTSIRRGKHIEDYQEYLKNMKKKEYLNPADIAEIEKKTKQIKDLLYRWETCDAEYFSKYMWYEEACRSWDEQNKNQSS